MLKKANTELRQKLKSNNIPFWRVAGNLNIHEKTLIAWLRVDLDEAKRKAVCEAVESLLREEGIDNG